MDPLVTISTTADGAETLAALARSLLDERLVACATITPGARSLYRWMGEVQDESEAVMELHTTTGRMGAVLARLAELHPYQVPQILARPVVGAHDGYAAWVEEQTS